MVAYHGDADGTGSAALAVRYLQRTGRTVAAALAPGKGEDLFGGAYADRLRQSKPDACWVLDQGSAPRALLPDVPTLVVDHHDAPARAGVPVACYLSGLGEQPVPPASLMAWRLLSPLVDLADASWCMAVGTIGDLGMDAPFEELGPAKKQWGQKNLSETVALVNAAKRSSAHDTATSLQALLDAQTPAEIAKGMVAEYDLLAEYRHEVQAERARCAKVAPKFAGDWAMLRFASGCQMHGIVAASWVGRLPKFIVLVANDGYTPGNVHFSIRTRRPDENLLTRLRAFREVIDRPDLGQGHKEATGGILPVAVFEQLIRSYRFSPARRVLRIALT